MERVVREYASSEAADAAEEEYWRRLSGAERLALLLDLIMPPNADEAVIERSARVYPFAQPRGG